MPGNTFSKEQTDKQTEREDIYIPDFSQLWKALYFKTEDAWADAFKKFVSTGTFVNFLDSILEQNLASEKVSRQILDKYFELVPVPSKKDIARVAELVISLEEKIDTIEFQVYQSFENMADSLIRMVEFQEHVNNEMILIKKDIEAVNKKLDNLNKKINTLKKSQTAREK